MDLASILPAVFDFLKDHWPATCMTTSLFVAGWVSGTVIFTKDRIDHVCARRWCGQCAWSLFFHWGRETLPIHPLVAGSAWGWLWLGGVPGASEGLAAGAASLLLWVYTKARAKQQGLDLWVVRPWS